MTTARDLLVRGLLAGLLAGVGDVRITDRDGGTIQVDVPLDPELSRDPVLRRVLRAVASTSVDLAAVPGESVDAEAPPDTEEHRILGD